MTSMCNVVIPDDLAYSLHERLMIALINDDYKNALYVVGFMAQSVPINFRYILDIAISHDIDIDGFIEYCFSTKECINSNSPQRIHLTVDLAYVIASTDNDIIINNGVLILLLILPNSWEFTCHMLNLINSLTLSNHAERDDCLIYLINQETDIWTIITDRFNSIDEYEAQNKLRYHNYSRKHTAYKHWLSDGDEYECTGNEIQRLGSFVQFVNEFCIDNDCRTELQNYIKKS